ncbi:hypothetical protein PISMIDRAFT_686306 [Pisolithus microcarpus 441]|uniref:Uncharacterized protein n=1 Tax=Pisolithus microcarpus 441 TaxID=765257 RepID=A0A0C9Z2C6_9AGAM|nr:hypothetical protein PISMIDRAFT_686306 [Pisolithus microcarpus 441]
MTYHVDTKPNSRHETQQTDKPKPKNPANIKLKVRFTNLSTKRTKLATCFQNHMSQRTTSRHSQVTALRPT